MLFFVSTSQEQLSCALSERHQGLMFKRNQGSHQGQVYLLFFALTFYMDGGERSETSARGDFQSEDVMQPSLSLSCA